jgi:hypothetical protein
MCPGMGEATHRGRVAVPAGKRGGPVEPIRAGDGVRFEPGEERWHGAARSAARRPRGYSPRCDFDARLTTLTANRDGCSRTVGLSIWPRRSISLIHWPGLRIASIWRAARRLSP